MKKSYLFSLLLSSSFNPGVAQQQEEKAFALLDSLSQHNFQATFQYNSRSPQEQLGEALEGTITVQGNQYRLSIGGQEIVNNGKTIWTYLPEANEVQITDHTPEQEAATPWTLLTSYRQAYRLFDFRTQQVGGQSYAVIALLAKDKAHALPQITLTMEQATKHIKRLEALDSHQHLHIFSITNFDPDVGLDAAFFNFNPKDYKNIEVIDMRAG